MPGLGQRLLGAAVAGAGATIVENARNRREETLLRLRRQWQVQDRADAAALTREGWDRADARAAEGRAHDLAIAGAKAAAPGNFHNLYDPKTEAIVSARKGSPEEADLIGKGYVVGRPHKPTTTVDVTTSSGPAKAPKGYRNVQMEDGSWAMEPVPGGPADVKAQEAAAKEAGRTESTKRQASLATTHIDAIKGILKDSPSTTTGIAGAFLSQIPSTSAHDLDRRIDTLKAMIGFNALNEMRANSPTGGALGNVTERELALLQSTVASLELSQSREQFLENLALVEEQFNRVVHGPEGGGGAAPGEDPNLEPAPNVALPPPETVMPLSAPAPASASAPGPELPGPEGSAATGRFAKMKIDELVAVMLDKSKPLSKEDMDAIEARMDELDAEKKALDARLAEYAKGG